MDALDRPWSDANDPPEQDFQYIGLQRVERCAHYRIQPAADHLQYVGLKNMPTRVATRSDEHTSRPELEKVAAFQNMPPAVISKKQLQLVLWQIVQSHGDSMA